MFLLSIFLAVSLSCISCQPPVMPRSQTYQGRDTDGTYSFGYTVHEPSGTTKFRQESGDGAGNRQGSYGLEEKDSQRIVFNYATKPKSSSQFVDHPVPLTSQQHENHGPPPHPPTPLITPSLSTVSAGGPGPSGPSGPRGEGGPMDGSSVDVGFSPSFEARGQEMDEDSRFNSPAFDEDFDFDGRSKGFDGGEPKMRQNSNTHWDGGESMGISGGNSGNNGGGNEPGPWNKQMNGGVGHNGHHHPQHHHHGHHRGHQPNSEQEHHHNSPPHHHHHAPPHHHYPQGGGEDTFGMNESSDLTNEPANYEQLVAYLANQQRSAGPPHMRPPIKPEDFAYKSR